MKISIFLNRTLAVLMLFFAFGNYCKAQDSILLLHGEVLKGKIVSDMGDFYRIELMKKKKVRSVAVEKLDIFSVILQGEPEKIIYRIDTALGNDFTRDQMRDFWEGEHQARLQYKPKLPLIGGALVGAASPLYGFWGLALAPIYMGAIAIRKPIPPKDLAVPVKVKDPEIYKMGYGYTARRIKVQRTALTTMAGLVTVWVVNVATKGLK